MSLDPPNCIPSNCNSSTAVGLKNRKLIARNLNCTLSILVHYRIFVVTPNIEPMVRDSGTQIDTISIEFQVFQNVKHNVHMIYLYKDKIAFQ